METANRTPAQLERMERIRSKIRAIPDFPKPGIFFRDITTLGTDPEGFGSCTDPFAER